jgi:hypothetical protein
MARWRGTVVEFRILTKKLCVITALAQKNYNVLNLARQETLRLTAINDLLF